MELVVRHINRQDIVCDVLIGGVLTSHKGINLPTRTLRAQPLTDKDKIDLQFGLANDVDFIGLSFVRGPEDVLGIKTLIRSANKQTPVIAKIEKHEALDHIDDIMDVSDGIMVARGDLGVEIPLEKVPGIQKMLVRKANTMGKPVIIATQMLRSMVNSPRPTRAEANDVANAVLDGADAIMLSEETASGDYPVQSLQYMARIAETAEKDFAHEKYLHLMPRKGISEAVAYASCVLADHLNAKAIIAPTRSGFTAAQISRFKPQTQIIALSPDPSTVRRLCLYWGCVPYHTEDSKDTDDMFEKAAAGALQTRHLAAGDLVIITAGPPGFVAGSTEMLRVKKL
jgi:pyruvate kinase